MIFRENHEDLLVRINRPLSGVRRIRNACHGCPTRFTRGWCEAHQCWMAKKCQEGQIPTRKKKRGIL